MTNNVVIFFCHFLKQKQMLVIVFEQSEYYSPRRKVLKTNKTENYVQC